MADRENSDRVHHFVTDILNNVCNCEQANKLHPIKYACAGRIVLGSLGGARMKEMALEVSSTCQDEAVFEGTYYSLVTNCVSSKN